MLSTQDLTFTYPGAAPMKFADITCQTGEQWLILGESGGGKTTLLHLLGGLRTPGSGKIMVDGTDLSKLGAAQLDKFRGKSIGIIFQQAHFVRSLSVKENLVLAQQLAGSTVDTKRILQVLDQLNIGHKVNKRPESLSVGEQQRVAIARAIINSPSVILADEPTSALDDGNTDAVIDLLKTSAQEVNATLLIVTHDNRLTSQFQNQIKL